MDELNLDTSQFHCQPASVVGINVEKIANTNQTRFQCSSAGNPVPQVSWHFPRVEDEFNWALLVIGNISNIVTANQPPGSNLVSQAFLTVSQRDMPAGVVRTDLFANQLVDASPGTNKQVRLVCQAVNSLGSASLMTSFDVESQIKKQQFKPSHLQISTPPPTSPPDPRIKFATYVS